MTAKVSKKNSFSTLSYQVLWLGSGIRPPRTIPLGPKIERYDKFIFIATDAAMASRWCNWEIGYGDAYKYSQDKIAIFPIKQDNRVWEGNEYLQLYPSIEYFDGTTKYKNGTPIPEGFYVYYHFRREIIPLIRWISK